jgi:hypothetical protein
VDTQEHWSNTARLLWLFFCMNLKNVTIDELTDEFRRLNHEYLSYSGKSHYRQSLKFREMRERLFAVINELRTRRSQQR